MTVIGELKKQFLILIIEWKWWGKVKKVEVVIKNILNRESIALNPNL